MKKLNYLLLFLIGFAQVSYAKLPKISQERVIILQKKYAQEEHKAKLLRIASMLTAASVIGYLTYEWLKPTDKISLEFSKEDIAKIKDNAIAYFESLKIAKINPISWAQWLKNNIISLPGFLMGVGSYAITMGINQRAQLFVTDIFVPRTLLWFAERKTVLAQTLNELYQEAETYKRGLITKVQLNQSMDASLLLLKEDVERILGYCAYAITLLPTEPLYNHTIAKSIVQRIEALTNQFIADMEQQADNTAAILRYTQDINTAIKSFAALENNQRNNLKVANPVATSSVPVKA